MSLTITNYKGYSVLTPDPTSGTPPRAINDAIKGLIDTSVQVLGQFPAPNIFSAWLHFSRNNYNYFHCETASPGWGGLFPALAQSSEIDSCFFNVGCDIDFCNECGTWCIESEVAAPFVLCAVNASYFTKLSINLKKFQLHPVALQSFTSLTQLKLNEFTFTNDNLVVANLNSLVTLNIHIKLSGSSTIAINNLPALTTLWMSGDSYGGMQGLTDANFTLDIASLPNIQYIALYGTGTGLSTTWIDNLFIALAASVVANPRSGFIDIGGSNNSVSGASAAARSYLSGPAGWDLTYNS